MHRLYKLNRLPSDSLFLSVVEGKKNVLYSAESGKKNEIPLSIGVVFSHLHISEPPKSLICLFFSAVGEFVFIFYLLLHVKLQSEIMSNCKVNLCQMARRKHGVQCLIVI